MSSSPSFTLADRLILFRYFNALFGAKTFEDLQAALRDQSPGYDSQGRSHYFNALKGRAQIPEDRLARYDANIRGDVEALNVRRPDPVQLKYFQYLAALYTEIFLDRRASESARFLRDLNDFVREVNGRESYSARFKRFEPDDLNKIAYWMATGSGKTLLLHINYRQFLRYQYDPGDNLLLITPPGGLLAAQHLSELRLSSVPSVEYDEEPPIGARHPVRVIEISKIAKDKNGGGVSRDVETFEGRNLLFVDEGHKGSGGEAWRDLRGRLGANGFTFEYSATFGQAINAARDTDLVEEYGKAIIFDYSYKYFYGDGYGKEYRVLNLREDRARDLTDTFLLANLLAFYEQQRVYSDHGRALKPYHLESPLWIFIGSSVNAVQTEGGQKKSDVLTVALLLDRALRNQNGWTTKTIDSILKGQAELKDAEGRDLFAGRFEYLRNATAKEIYRDILRLVFRADGPGGLRLIDIKNADGEIGLKAGSSETYFGVINIGDTSAFFKLVDQEPSLAHEEDKFAASLFDTLQKPDSPVNILIGSKKFIEGWSSWRVSAMGLLNIGRSEGPQIIQLFGRGVRLQGKGRSLRRSRHLPGSHPDHVELLETLNIFGVRADNMSQFREYLEKEGVPSSGYEEVVLPIRINEPFLKEGLVVPRLKPGVDFAYSVFLTLPPNAKAPTVDLRPQVTALSSLAEQSNGGGTADQQRTIAGEVLNLFDWDRLYLDLLEFKTERGWHNLHIPRESVEAVLRERQYTLLAAESDVKPRSYADLARVQAAAKAVLEKYIESYYQRARNRWESEQLEYRTLDKTDDNLAFGEYRLKIPADKRNLIAQINKLLKDADRLYGMDGNLSDLPRIIFDRHLYQPLLAVLQDVTISPPPLDDNERAFVDNLRGWLSKNVPTLKSIDVFLLRNQSRGKGIGFFEESGFYPDFILWLKQGKKQRLVFVDPHGLLLDSDPEDGKVQLHRRLKELEAALGNPNVSLDSFLISTTAFADLTKRRAWQGYSRAAFAQTHILFQDDELALLFAG